MGQKNEFVEIFKRDLVREQENLRLYQRGELRSMTLEADRWCDTTLIAIEQTKQRIAELKARITKYEKISAQPDIQMSSEFDVGRIMEKKEET